MSLAHAHGVLWTSTLVSAVGVFGCGGGSDESGTPRTTYGADVDGGDAASYALVDAGADARVERDAATSSGALNPFASDPSFVQDKALRSAKIQHADRGVGIDPTRQNCLGSNCHGGNSRRFAFGLTVCGDAKCAGAGATDAEVRVVGADGKVFATTSDANGNAWFYDNGMLKFPAWAAVRKAGAVKTMQEPLIGTVTSGAGGCNNALGCHGKDDPATPEIKNVILWVR